ncbi:MAG: aminotransferase class III-fold pyridoxal phosphate-dependent enzyme [Bacteroidota bacterium]
MSTTESIFFSPEQVKQLTATYFGLEVSVRKMPGYLDLNYYLKSADGREYLLKIAHFGEERASLEMQNALMLHLEKKGGAISPAVIPNQSGQTITPIEDAKGKTRYMRLLTWLSGQLWAQTQPKSAPLRHALGQTCAHLNRQLLDFTHPAAHRELDWDLSQSLWVKAKVEQWIKSSEQKALLHYFIDLFEQRVVPAWGQLRKSVIHGDVNDYNIIVRAENEKQPICLFDFGDSLYTHTINELAIAAAYVAMHQPDPLAAVADLVRGYHQGYPLEEKEVELIYSMMAMRLCVSVVAAAGKRQTALENTYLSISEQPGWEVLHQWRDIDPQLAHYTFRAACNWEPCPQAIRFQTWVKTARQQGKFRDVLAVDWSDTAFKEMDLRVGSLELGNNEHFLSIERFSTRINHLLAEAKVDFGLGGYLEVRPFYTTDAYLVEGNNGPQWRTVHLGLDLWSQAGTAVYAPLDGRVYGITNNEGDCNYGPTIILQHQVDRDLTFYTLYGHLSLHCLGQWSLGQAVKAGTKIAEFGPAPENGNWPPHLHFQIMLDMLGYRDDFPGVAFPEQQAVWQSICPDPALLMDGVYFKKQQPSQLEQELIQKRKSILGPNLSLSYQQPLHMVRGFKQYLYDITGRRYLDTVNNVPHVGHQHPRVVKAAQQQMALLNTNTRYLHENIIAFAEELSATFPDPLKVCFFVNSGSEANELALRMARTYSGQNDMLAVEVGYHGNTGAVVDVSSYKFDGKGGQGAPAHTHLLPIPDCYRGIYREETAEAAAQKYAQHATTQIEKLRHQGKRIAGFICESILSCGGQIVLPKGYLQQVFPVIRAAGGLCIMDEVQVGFGRTGDHFWAFEKHGVIPDIVTMGKPIGNGHPLAAVVTTKEIAHAFANGMEYFNTFGGNPVSCAIGRKVLQIVKEEKLQENAKTTGAYLREKLRGLQEQFPIIGQLRGPGFFQGMELVCSRETLAPATQQTSYLANRMRERGVLMSVDGPLYNVIKIKPPMCFDRANVDFLLHHLELVFREDRMQT